LPEALEGAYLVGRLSREVFMRDDDLWALEIRFWKDGAEFYREFMADEGLMSFAAPVGMLDKRKTLKSLSGTPRWKRVRFARKKAVRPNPHCAVLAYRVKAARGARDSYDATCLSCYVRAGRAWKLVAHQQMPGH